MTPQAKWVLLWERARDRFAWRALIAQMAILNSATTPSQFEAAADEFRLNANRAYKCRDRMLTALRSEPARAAFFGEIH